MKNPPTFCREVIVPGGRFNRPSVQKIRRQLSEFKKRAGTEVEAIVILCPGGVSFIGGDKTDAQIEAALGPYRFAIGFIGETLHDGPKTQALSPAHAKTREFLQSDAVPKAWRYCVLESKSLAE